MAPNFAHLLTKQASDVKRPPALPKSIYPGIVKSYTFGESSQKKTPYVQFLCGYMGWPDDVDPADRQSEDGKPIDLSKKTAKVDFYLTDDALWRLAEFLQAVHPNDHRSMEELIPATVGAQVYIDVEQKIGDDNNPYNETRRLYAESQLAEAQG